MPERGAFKIASRHRAFDAIVEVATRGGRRTRRIVDSLRHEILEAEGRTVRVRRIFETPRDVYRLELELPEMGYQRTTLLDRDSLEELLATDEVRARVRDAEALG